MHDPTASFGGGIFYFWWGLARQARSRSILSAASNQLDVMRFTQISDGQFVAHGPPLRED